MIARKKLAILAAVAFGTAGGSAALAQSSHAVSGHHVGAATDNGTKETVKGNVSQKMDETKKWVGQSVYSEDGILIGTLTSVKKGDANDGGLLMIKPASGGKAMGVPMVDVKHEKGVIVLPSGKKN